MAREDLQADLRSLLNKATASNKTVRREGIRLYKNGVKELAVEINPIWKQGGPGQFYLITFQETAPPPVSAKTGEEATVTAPTTPHEDLELQRLRDELMASKEYLHAIIEQQEVSNEELTSANEEIQASNEELQSINEELETAKEELQSTNEELATVNDELESRNNELELLSNDLGNLIGGLSTAIIMVDKELCIRRFTPEAEKSLKLAAADLGQSITQLKLNINIPDLRQRLITAIDTLSSEELEVQDNSGHWYKVQIRPYKTNDNKIDGAVLACFDIDVIKRSLARAERARDYAEAIVAAMRYPLLVLDHHLQVVSASAAYYEKFQVSPKDTVGNLLYRLGNGQWGIPDLRLQLEAVLNGKGDFDDYVVEHDFEGLGHRQMLISGRKIPAGIEDVPMVLMQLVDITDQSDIGDRR
jgi:two-component system CheB/CheR fusion protein